MRRDVNCQKPRDRKTEHEFVSVCVVLLRETSFNRNGILCRLRMFDCGWLWEVVALFPEE